MISRTRTQRRFFSPELATDRYVETNNPRVMCRRKDSSSAVALVADENLRWRIIEQWINRRHPVQMIILDSIYAAPIQVPIKFWTGVLWLRWQVATRWGIRRTLGLGHRSTEKSPNDKDKVRKTADKYLCWVRLLTRGARAELRKTTPLGSRLGKRWEVPPIEQFYSTLSYYKSLISGCRYKSSSSTTLFGRDWLNDSL